jgi:hypothetical protein
MKEQVEILKKLFSATERMNAAIRGNDIDMLEQMLEERDVLLASYKKLNSNQLSASEQELVNKLIDLDKENNSLLETIVDVQRTKMNDTTKEKNEAVKRTRVAKKYMSVGTGLSEYSKFNTKT